eukprot:1179064-Rhodomonas_salina.2
MPPPEMVAFPVSSSKVYVDLTSLNLRQAQELSVRHRVDALATRGAEETDSAPGQRAPDGLAVDALALQLFGLLERSPELDGLCRDASGQSPQHQTPRKPAARAAPRRSWSHPAQRRSPVRLAASGAG